MKRILIILGMVSLLINVAFAEDSVLSHCQQEALKILNNTGVTTMVISHQNSSIGYQNELWVEKIFKHQRSFRNQS